jgi:hypothetical protein
MDLLSFIANGNIPIRLSIHTLALLLRTTAAARVPG